MNTQEKRIIEKMYGRLYRITESSRDFENLTDLCKKEERDHRKIGARFTDGRARYNMPIGKTAEYFAVKEVLDGLKITYGPESFLTVRQSCLIGAGIAAKYRARIMAETTEEERAEFLALDYCKLIE